MARGSRASAGRFARRSSNGALGPRSQVGPGNASLPLNSASGAYIFDSGRAVLRALATNLSYPAIAGQFLVPWRQLAPDSSENPARLGRGGCPKFRSPGSVMSSSA
jgi:hypothetical protein